MGPIAEEWATSNNQRVVDYEVTGDLLTVTALGAPPEISTALRTSLDDSGYEALNLTVELVVGGTQNLPGTGQGSRGSSVGSTRRWPLIVLREVPVEGASV